MTLKKDAQSQLEKIAEVCQAVLITLACYLIILLINIIFVPYRYILDIILKVKLVEKYGGLFSPHDLLFFRSDISRITVTGILIIRSNEKRCIFNEVKGIFQKKVFASADYAKMKATVGRFGGYPYMIKDTCNINECINKLQIPENVTFDEEYLKELAGSIMNNPLPQNDKALWEMLISEKSLKSANDDFYRYPIIFRCHHALGAGSLLMPFASRMFGEEEAENFCEIVFDTLSGRKEKKPILKRAEFYLSYMKKVIYDFIFTWTMGIGCFMKKNIRPLEANGLHGPVLTGEKIVAWNIEDNVKFIPLVKRIKTTLDTKFANVIMTAISASLTNYLKRKHFPVPPSMSVLMPVLLEYPKLQKSQSVPLENNSAAIIFDLATHSNDSLIETLDKISKSYEELNFVEAKASRFISKPAGRLPIILQDTVLQLPGPTFGLSNLPGGDQIKLLGGSVIEKIVPLSATGGLIGVMFALLTYDNRLHLGITVDKAIIQSQQEAQKIIDDVFYYITLLGEEAKEVYGQIGKLLKVCQLMIITFVCYPILIVIGSIFLCYRYIIDIILKVKVGEKYGGLLALPDAYFFRGGKSKTYTSIIFILKSKKERDFLKESKKLLQEKVFDTTFYPKLTGTVDKFGGYLYLNKNGCELDECLKEMEVPENVTFDEDYLKVLRAAHVNKPFPQNGTVLWEFSFSKKPLYRNNFSDVYFYYPIITRFHHAVGDGTSLMALILRLFTEYETDIYSEKITNNLLNKKHEKMSFIKTLSLLLEQVKEATKDIFYTYFIGIGKVVHDNLKMEDDNALHGPVLTGEKIVAWTTEDSVKLVPLVKKVKSRLDTKFSAVVLTAVSASLTNFFERNSYPVPKSMSFFFPRLMESYKMNKSEPIALKNNAAGVAVSNFATHTSSSLIETLGKVSKAYNDIKNGEFKLSEFILKNAAILPMSLFNKVFIHSHQTFTMTNVPGCPQVNLLDCLLEKVISVAPNLDEIAKNCNIAKANNTKGVAFTLFTYDNRFQLGLMVDKALIQSQKEAQKIVDDIFYYIEMLDEESRALEKTN